MKVVVEAGVSFLTIHGNAEIITAAAEARGNSGLKLLSVTVLTCLDVKDIRDLGSSVLCKSLLSIAPRKRLRQAATVLLLRQRSQAYQGSDARRSFGGNAGIRPLGGQLQDHKRSGVPRCDRRWGGLL